VQILAYDDDGVIVQKYENAVKVEFNRFEKKAQKGVSVIN